MSPESTDACRCQHKKQRYEFLTVEERTRYGLVTRWVSNVDELLNQNRVLLVIPIAKNNGEFVVVLICFDGRDQ